MRKRTALESHTALLQISNMFVSTFTLVLVTVALLANVVRAQTDLPPGLPEGCYDTGPGSQYGIKSQGPTVYASNIVAPNSTIRDDSTAYNGDSVSFTWQPAPCYPNKTFAIATNPPSNVSTPVKVYSPDVPGNKLIGLGGWNDTFNASMVLDSDYFTKGQVYKVSLWTFNDTTGDLGGSIHYVNFAWEAPYPN